MGDLKRRGGGRKREEDAGRRDAFNTRNHTSEIGGKYLLAESEQCDVDAFRTARVHTALLLVFLGTTRMHPAHGKPNRLRSTPMYWGPLGCTCSVARFFGDHSGAHMQEEQLMVRCMHDVQYHQSVI